MTTLVSKPHEPMKILVRSRSDPDHPRTVTITNGQPTHCSCPGFKYRCHCRHLDIAAEIHWITPASSPKPMPAHRKQTPRRPRQFNRNASADHTPATSQANPLQD